MAGRQPAERQQARNGQHEPGAQPRPPRRPAARCLDQALPRAEGKDLRLELEVPRELEAVAIDKDLFRIALNNLMTNAIKYNVPGGTCAGARNDDHEIVISVRDTGIGMSAGDTRARVPKNSTA
jgi:signal transduction histidine kinase